MRQLLLCAIAFISTTLIASAQSLSAFDVDTSQFALMKAKFLRAVVDLDISTRGHARLSLMNTLGTEVSMFLDKVVEAGHHQIVVEVQTLPAGV